MTETTTTRARSVREWLTKSPWRILIGAGLAATVLGLLSALVLKAGLAAAGRTISWPRAFAGFTDWYLWALLSPLIVRLARAVPLSPERWPTSLAAHLPLGVGVALLELALFTLVNAWYNRVVLEQAYPSFASAYLEIVARWLPTALVIYALIVAVVTAVDYGREVRERALAAARLETELARTQIRELQARIEPHFLFNTLNTISVLVREGRRAAAVDAMADLGRILRRSMARDDDVETTLEREIRFTRDYLRLEKHRLEERLEYDFQVDPGTLGARVPTLLLQPLVENAIRHGIQDRPEGGRVTVRSERVDGALELEVRNPGVPAGGEADGGMGLSNVRARLRAHYGDDARLSLDSGDPGEVRARVRIPFESADREGAT